MTRRTIGFIGVPSSAGAHWPGQEKAPGMLRGAGLVEHIESAGCTVVDHADEEGEPAAVFVREVADVLAGNVP